MDRHSRSKRPAARLSGMFARGVRRRLCAHAAHAPRPGPKAGATQQSQHVVVGDFSRRAAYYVG